MDQHTRFWNLFPCLEKDSRSSFCLNHSLLPYIYFVYMRSLGYGEIVYHDAGSPESSLHADGMRTQILCAGPFIQLNMYSARNLYKELVYRSYIQFLQEPYC